MEIWNKNILIAGFGRIGQSLIKRCLGFEMNVFVYDPFVSREKIEEMGGKKVDNLIKSVKDMDAISLHMPLNNETENMINYDLLKTRKNYIIINAARGGIINEIDLDKALNENIIFGAGMDVLKMNLQKNPLLKNDKVFKSSFCNFYRGMFEKNGKGNYTNIIDFFNEKLDKSKIVRLINHEIKFKKFRIT